MNITLIIFEGSYGAIDSDDSTCHGYYIIIFSSYPYKLKADYNIGVHVICSGEMVCKGNYYFSININSIYIFSPKQNKQQNSFSEDNH